MQAANSGIGKISITGVMAHQQGAVVSGGRTSGCIPGCNCYEHAECGSQQQMV